MIFLMILPLAFLLDAAFGDPRFIYHPVVMIGNLISALEKSLRKHFPKTEKGEYISGIVLWILTTTVSFTVPLALLLTASKLDLRLRLILELFWCWQIFAANSLMKESMKVYKAVISGDLEASRKQLSMIVGRDTAELSFEQIIKAAVETVAENASDGVIAPMLFMLIGGAPLGFFYKAVNTLDSMVGYHNEKYEYFGRFSAKADDVFNFIPARITALTMIAGSLFLKLNFKNSYKIFVRDRKKHKSPNSGYPESACAGALSVQLAGDASYFGKQIKKQTIGDSVRPIEAKDILRANMLMYASSVISLIVLSLMRYMTIKVFI